MAEPATWWHHHQLRPPAMTPDMRWAVQRYPWGVAVWEGPTRATPFARHRIVEVVLTDPDAPKELALEHASARMPRQSVPRRVARALPFPATSRGVVTAGVVLGVVLMLASVTEQAAWLLLAIPLLVATFALVDRLPPENHLTWRRRGHQAYATPFTGRFAHADALCSRSRPQPHGRQVRRVVRVALWECRHDDPAPGGGARIDRWLADLSEGDELVQLIGTHAGSADQAPVVAQAVAVAPELLALLATSVDDERRQVLRQLRQLREACDEARAARERLESTVTSASEVPPEARRALGGVSSADVAAQTHHVDALLDQLRSESTILREVDAELRQRDDPGRESSRRSAGGDTKPR